MLKFDLPTNPDVVREFATSVVRTLRNSGHVAFWAGGCVRDLLLGRVPSDYDIATDATPERVIKLFRRTSHVGISFGVVRVLGDGRSLEVEVATFRSDGEYLDGRRPESVTFGSAEADATRRDFTINGMFYDPITCEVIDYVGGLEDLESRRLRAIGNAVERFEEDKLRLLRAARFAARFDLAIDGATRHAIELMSPRVTVVAAERIAQELRRMLTHPSRAQAMSLARDLGLLGAIVPAMLSVSDEQWTRTSKALARLPADAGFSVGFTILVADLGVEEVTKTCNELRLSNEERLLICWLVEHADAVDSANLPRSSKLKRLFAHSNFPELLKWWRAEGQAKVQTVEFVERYHHDLPDGPIDPPPILNGRDLIAQGYQPGRSFSGILEAVRNAQLEGAIASRDSALIWVRDYLKAVDERG